MENQTEVTNIGNTKNSLIIKIIYLLIAIVLMAFAQAILSYTHSIGMAPIDSGIQGFAWVIGWTYVQWNYIAVGILVLTAVILSKPKDMLLTSTAFITGYCLAFLVGFISANIVKHFPGLIEMHDTHGTIIRTIDHGVLNYVLGIIWFLVGYSLLVVSIGMWLNVGFGLRPYDVLIVRLSERFDDYSYVFFRNVLDLSLVIFSLIVTSLSLATYPDTTMSNWEEFVARNSVFVGSILFVTCTGYLTNYTRIAFEKLLTKLS